MYLSQYFSSASLNFLNLQQAIEAVCTIKGYGNQSISLAEIVLFKAKLGNWWEIAVITSLQAKECLFSNWVPGQ